MTPIFEFGRTVLWSRTPWWITGLAIKNGHQRKWFYKLAGGINQKSIVTTFVPYIYRYWNKQQLLHLVAFNFSYDLQLIRSESIDFTNLSRLRYRQLFPSNHWNTYCKNLSRSVPYHYSICFCIKYFSGLRKKPADISSESDL